MLNIVIPMAGRGSRFVQAGYTVPKPLIEIYGHPMIAYVTANLTPAREHRFIYLCLQEHIEKYHLKDVLQDLAPGCCIVPVDQVTEGAACTVLLVERLIDCDEPLMIANSDQWITMPIDQYLAKLSDQDGLIMTMYADDPKWSYIGIDETGYVQIVREKEVISEEATVGIYNFAHGRDFVKYAHEMIAHDERVNGEFYVAPVYNRMIQAGKRVGYCNVGQVNDGMYGLGTPEDLTYFLAQNITLE